MTTAFVMAWIAEILRECLRVAWVFPALTLVELALPAGQQCSLVSRLRGAVFWLFWIPSAALTVTAFWWFWRQTGVRPLLTIDLRGPDGLAGPAAWGLAVAGMFTSWVLGDFFFYWYHRAQHAWFWRFHRVHHAIREMSAINCCQHIADESIRVALMVFPSALLFDVNARELVLLTLIAKLQGQFVHTATRLHLGPLRRLFNDNRFHRIHHSIEERHWHVNFGGTTTLWDQVFRTAYFPKPDEWPETGLADFADPESVKDYLLGPLRPISGEATSLGQRVQTHLRP